MCRFDDMTIRDILKGIDCKIDRGGLDIGVTGITDDSRFVAPGDLFLAVRGYSVDGHLFINNAIRSGAKAIVAESNFEAPETVIKILVKDTRKALSVIASNFYGHPSERLKIAGITGTNGKTTITYILENIIKCSGCEAGVVGTVSHRIKDRVIPSKNTTPGVRDLQKMLREMVEGKVEYAFLEVSSHSLDQGRVEGIEFDAAVFTNITSEHLDYHRNMEDYFKAKAKLFYSLKKDGFAILNADDEKVISLKDSLADNILTYGFSEKADVRAENVRLSLEGSAFKVRTPIGTFDIDTKLVGRHNISNILASVAVSHVFGVDINAVKEGVDSSIGAPGRLERIDQGQPFMVFVDYAHTEDALKNILTLLREVGRRRIITVFGCGGNRDKTKRPAMGKAACSLSDDVVITSDNPRFEPPECIIFDIEKGIEGQFSNYSVEIDRRVAIEKALRMADADDVVVIAGKGHEDYQVIRDKVMPFSDRSVVIDILKKMDYEGKRNNKDNQGASVIGL